MDQSYQTKYISFMFSEISFKEKIKKKFSNVLFRTEVDNKTWDIQYKSLIQKKAFLVYLKKNQKFLGFGYFFHSKDECLYAVAANYRTEMTKHKSPLGHLIQFFAIQELIRRSIQWYKLGEENLGFKSTIDQKNLNIVKFKKGFSSHELPIFHYTLKF